MTYRNPTSVMIKAVFYALASVLIPAAFAYDGPVGVTFRAPAMERGAGPNGVSLEEMSVREKVRIDDHGQARHRFHGTAAPCCIPGRQAGKQLQGTRA